MTGLRKYQLLAVSVLIMALWMGASAAPYLDQIMSIKDKIQTYMENDLKGCQGVQETLKELSFGELRNPTENCRIACLAKSAGYTKFDYKYSGPTVICCCYSE